MATFKSLAGNKVINGTYAKVILDGEEITAAKRVQIKYEMDMDEILLPGQFTVDHCPKKGSGKGSIAMYKIDSSMIKLVGDKMKKGEPMNFTLIISVNDPKAYGSERIAVNNVYFTDLTLADWERAKNAEIECPLVCGDYEPIDLI